MKKYIIGILTLFVITSCERDLTGINKDPKAPTIAPGGPFFTSAEKSFVDLYSTGNYGFNIFRFIVQQWQQTIYIRESQYELTDRQLPQAAWDGLYRDVIRDLREAKKLIPADPTISSAVQQNQLAIAEIMEIYAWYYLVTTFGDIPYADALDISKPSPAYDNQKTIYYQLLTRLDAAIDKINIANAGFGTADKIYNGNMASWKKFANTIKLQMGMTIADDNNAEAKTIVESAVQSGVFTSNADNATFKYLTAAPNNNPVHAFFITANREEDFVAASTYVNAMKNLNDPRIDNYFTEDAAGGYSGGNPGQISDWVAFSKPSPGLLVTDYPAVLFDYAEVEFLLAEAVQRGYTVGGTAKDHYDEAITASILFWGGTVAEATNYLAQAAVAFDAAAWKQKIGTQKWLALYNRGWNAWIEWRRLDYPQLQPAMAAISEIPVRFTYPTQEQNVNKDNYTAASAAMGGDAVNKKLFWDKF